MQSLLTVSLPVFGLMFCGYLAGRLRVLGADSSEALNRFVYYFALPALLFVFVARAFRADFLLAVSRRLGWWSRVGFRIDRYPRAISVPGSISGVGTTIDEYVVR